MLAVWLVACLLPLHGMASGLLAVLGPQHVHQIRQEVRVLDDVRRLPTAAPARRPASAFGLGHVHAHDGWQRHHHRHDDASIVKAAGGAAEATAGDADDAGFSPALSAFVALLGAAPVRLPPAGTDALAAGPGWALLTHTPRPIDRPPRSA